MFLPIGERQLLLTKGVTLGEELVNLNWLREDSDKNDNIQKTRKERDGELT